MELKYWQIYYVNDIIVHHKEGWIIILGQETFNIAAKEIRTPRLGLVALKCY